MKRRKKHQTVNKRIGVIDGIQGMLATLGYFTPPVQRVLRKWRGRVLQQFVEDYFFVLARAALWETNELRLSVKARAHWPLVWELATALEKVRTMPVDCPTYWLLRMKINIATNDRDPNVTEWATWDEIVNEIRQKGGPIFTPTALRLHANRLRLVPRIAVAKDAPHL